MHGAEEWESDRGGQRRFLLSQCQLDTYCPFISRQHVISRSSQQHTRRSAHGGYNVTRHCCDVDCHGSNPREWDGDAVWRLLWSPHHPTRPRRQSCLRGSYLLSARFDAWGSPSGLRASDSCVGPRWHRHSSTIKLLSPPGPRSMARIILQLVVAITCLRLLSLGTPKYSHRGRQNPPSHSRRHLPRTVVLTQHLLQTMLRRSKVTPLLLNFRLFHD